MRVLLINQCFYPDHVATAQHLTDLALGLVEAWLADFVAQRNRGVIPAALLFALWTASTGMSAVISTLNAAYNVAETRPFWKISLLAIGLTVISATLCVGGHLLLLSGSWLIEWLSSPALGAGGDGFLRRRGLRNCRRSTRRALGPDP